MCTKKKKSYRLFDTAECRVSGTNSLSCATHPLWEGRLPQQAGHPFTEGPRWAAQPANGMRRSKAPKEPPSRTDEENEEYQQLLADSQDYEDMLAQVRAWYERKALDEEVKAALAVEAQRINELIALKEEDRKRRTQEAESPASAAPPSNKQRQSKAKGGKLTRQAREAQLINQMIAVRKRVAENVAAEEERRVQDQKQQEQLRLQASAKMQESPRILVSRSGAGMGHFGLHIEDWSDGASTQSQSSTSNDSGPDGTAFSFADSDTPTELTKASARGLPSSSHAAHDALAWSGIVGDDGSSFMSRGGGRGGGGSVPYDSPPKSLFERARPPRRSLSYSTMSDAAVAEERVEAEKAQDASNDASAENSIGSHGTADGLAPPPSDTRHLSSTGRTVQTRQSNPAMRRMQLLIHNRAVGGGGRRGTREERDDAETKFWLDHRQEYAIRRREEAGTPLNVSPTARRLRQRSTGTAGPANETNESSLVGAHLNSYSQAALERLSTFHTHASRHPSPF